MASSYPLLGQARLLVASSTHGLFANTRMVLPYFLELKHRGDKPLVTSPQRPASVRPR
jgi:hypothetical protein